MAQHLSKYKRTNYEIIRDIPGKALIIRDIGPWDEYLSVTNDAENVVKELVTMGKLTRRRRLFYFDSAGTFDEIVMFRSEFVGFAAGPI